MNSALEDVISKKEVYRIRVKKLSAEADEK